MKEKLKKLWNEMKSIKSVTFEFIFDAHVILRTLSIISIGFSWQWIVNNNEWYMWVAWIVIQWASLNTLDNAYKYKYGVKK
ncbi:hypothetical protein ABH963_000063 [Bacillus sp. RC55]|uniref:hypothetical protein n=1 Tax=Bacillus sp. RC55 TaxID=3156292 RepID=UPI0038396306